MSVLYRSIAFLLNTRLHSAQHLPSALPLRSQWNCHATRPATTLPPWIYLGIGMIFANRGIDMFLRSRGAEHEFSLALPLHSIAIIFPKQLRTETTSNTTNMKLFFVSAIMAVFATAPVALASVSRSCCSCCPAYLSMVYGVLVLLPPLVCLLCTCELRTLTLFSSSTLRPPTVLDLQWSGRLRL